MPDLSPDAERLVWETCSIIGHHIPNIEHAQYRGMDVHKWKHFYCFNSMEGEATQEEMCALSERITVLSLPLSRPLHRGVSASEATRHYSEGCSLKQRHDNEMFNYCLEIATIRELDMILDALYGQLQTDLDTEFGKVSLEAPKVGRWR